MPSLKEVSHLPVIVDPSHATGRLSLIEPMSLAAAAAGADGILIEVHHKPAEAMCDKDQAMPPDMFAGLMKKLHRLLACLEGMKTGGQNAEGEVPIEGPGNLRQCG